MMSSTRTLEILGRLIAFPTVSRDSNLALIEWTQTFLQAAGFAVTRIPSTDTSKAGLFASIGPDVADGICLSAHSDVVPVDGQNWTRPAFALTDDDTRVFGRGTTDMKGFLASALALGERIDGDALKAPLSMSISYDEEIGCVGIQEMLPHLKQLIGHPRAVIVGEPTSMQIATGHKGKAAFKLRCRGQAGHSALAPDFVNAIHVAADLVHEIQALQKWLVNQAQDAAYTIPYSTVHIGKIAGGQALNIVPDQTDLEIEIRHLDATPIAELTHELERIAAKVSTKYPQVPAIDVMHINAYPGLHTAEGTAALVLAKTLTHETNTIKVPFGTEAGVFAQLGLNTVVIGPGDMAQDGHKADEGLAKSQLSACDAMMDRIASQLMVS